MLQTLTKNVLYNDIYSSTGKLLETNDWYSSIKTPLKFDPYDIFVRRYQIADAKLLTTLEVARKLSHKLINFFAYNVWKGWLILTIFVSVLELTLKLYWLLNN